MGLPGLTLAPLLIHPWSRYSIGAHLLGLNLTWGGGPADTANKALFVPFYLPTDAVLRRIGWGNGAAVSGNVDAGVYRQDGGRVVSTGSTVQSGTDSIQTVDITDTALAPGLYYMACVISNTTGNIRCLSENPNKLAAMGCFQQASALALPSSFTAATMADTNGPFPFLIFGRYT